LAVEGIVIFYLLYSLARQLMLDASPAGERGAPVLTAGLTLGLVAALGQLNRRVLPVIDRRFFRDAYDARAVLIELSRAVRRLASRPAELVDTVKRRVQESLHSRFVTLQLRDPRWSVLAPQAAEPVVAEAGGGRHLEVALSAAEAAVMVTRLAARAGDPEPRPVVFSLADPAEEQAGGEGLLVPVAGGGGVMGFLVLGEKLSEEPYTKEDKELLQTVAEQTAIALENAQLFSQVAEQDRLRREVEIAREVQEQLFPRVFPPLATLRYCGSCQPARAVGGDYYDFIALGRSRLGIALGDIAGKGISAALLMTSLHAMLRSHALLGSDDLATLASDINRLLYQATDAARYATFFYGVFEADSRRLRYVNAGHIPPILIRPEDSAGTFHRLCEGGPVIGLLPEPAYEPGSVALRPGDVIVIVSDGISEAENPEGDMFGEERVARLVAEHAHDSETEIHDRIVEAVLDFRAGAPQGDDTTLIVAKVS
jgi:sigma-B regulation protein RsbU (phosphoserine phosphatase)